MFVSPIINQSSWEPKLLTRSKDRDSFKVQEQPDQGATIKTAGMIELLYFGHTDYLQEQLHGSRCP